MLFVYRIFIFNKNLKNPFDVCSSFRAFVLSSMSLSLKVNFYAKSISLIS